MPDVDYFSYPDLRLSGGKPNLLSLRSVDVSYGQVQVLFGVSLELRRGETIALLGTNGAGKSTVLRAISGLVAPRRGSISHEGTDISGMGPHHIALKGVIQVPGGRGVFPSLSVAENLKVALWMHRRDREYAKTATEEALNLFPALRSRLGDPAAQLSGGQQQMLALAMAFLAKPDVLMIDELSLGLAPLVVEQLLAVVRQFREQGCHRDPRRAVGEHRTHHGRQGVLHGEGRDPLPRSHVRAARTSRPPAFDLPGRCGSRRWTRGR